jgi:DNA-directed RNA polymerase specialized sigma24 family protein
MYNFRSIHNAQAEAGYATCSDLCGNLVADLQPLYVLAFLLTGSHSEAEQCFVATVDDAIKASGVFKGWERSWNKRCLVINAIHRVFSGRAASDDKLGFRRDVNVESRGYCAIEAVAELAPPLQRFVFVMSVLERYSERECAVLLGRAPREIRQARIYAFWQLSGFPPALARNAG